MTNNNLAHPYVNAIFELANTENTVDTWLSDLSSLACIAQSKGFASLIGNPRISKEDILATLCNMLGNVRDPVLQFLLLLQANDRLMALPDIFVLYEQKVDNDRNIAKAIVQSAYAMSVSTQQQLEKLLSNKFSKSITTTVEINKELIGGIKILINDIVIDASVKGSLDNLATQLIR